MLTQNGLKRKDKVDMLCVSIKTIDNTTNKLYKKCNLKNIMQAEKKASNNRLIYEKKNQNTIKVKIGGIYLFYNNLFRHIFVATFGAT